MDDIIVKRKKRSAIEKEEIDPFTPEERTLILGALNGQVRNYAEFALWSGLRTSELIALRWSDIDFPRGVIRVRRAFVMGEGKGPKTEAGNRDRSKSSPGRLR